MTWDQLCVKFRGASVQKWFPGVVVSQHPKGKLWGNTFGKMVLKVVITNLLGVGILVHEKLIKKDERPSVG